MAEIVPFPKRNINTDNEEVEGHRLLIIQWNDQRDMYEAECECGNGYFTTETIVGCMVLHESHLQFKDQ